MRRSERRGFALPTVLVTLVGLAAIATAIVPLSFSRIELADAGQRRLEQRLLLEAGLSRGLLALLYVDDPMTETLRRDGRADPLDRWSERVIGGLAGRFGGVAVFPFAGPPYQPFLRWGMRAEGLTASPLGFGVDAEVGLWHGFRGAIVTAEDLGPEAAAQTSPCATCAGRPCLSACPANAFDAAGYDVAACRRFLESHAGGLCRTDGCRARDACPVGRRHRYAADQIRFLMSAFRASPPETPA